MRACLLSVMLCVTDLVAALRVGVQTPLSVDFLQQYWAPTFALATNDTLDMVAVQSDDDVYGLLDTLDLMYGSASLMNCLIKSTPALNITAH